MTTLLEMQEQENRQVFRCDHRHTKPVPGEVYRLCAVCGEFVIVQVLAQVQELSR